MNRYKAIANNDTKKEWLLTLEQDANRLKKSFINYAIDRCFEEQCREGVYAQDVSFTVYRNNTLVCKYVFEMHIDGSTAWSNVFVYVYPKTEKTFIRQMIIAE